MILVESKAFEYYSMNTTALYIELHCPMGDKFALIIWISSLTLREWCWIIIYKLLTVLLVFSVCMKTKKGNLGLTEIQSSSPYCMSHYNVKYTICIRLQKKFKGCAGNWYISLLQIFLNILFNWPKLTVNSVIFSILRKK